MSPVLQAFLFGTLGAPVGGLVAAVVGVTLLRNASHRVHAVLLAFAGGFILAVAHVELLARGLRHPVGPALALVAVGFMSGAAIRGLVARAIEARGAESHGHLQARRIAFSLALVNLLEGLPVGAGFAVGTGLGVLIGLVMVFENFMEGITVSTELATERSRGWRAWVLPTAPTATLGIGAAAGAWLGGLSQQMLPAVLGAGAGIMVYVVVDDILYEAHREGRGPLTIVPVLAGMVVGILFTGVSH